MEIIYSDEAQRDIEYWKTSGNKMVQRKIQQLLNAIEENPHKGIGKPEPLRHKFSGYGHEELTRNTGSYTKYLKTSKQ